MRQLCRCGMQSEACCCSVPQCCKPYSQQVNRLTAHSLVHGEGGVVLKARGEVGYTGSRSVMRRSYGVRRAPKVRVWTNPDVDPLAPHLLGSRRQHIYCVYDQDSDSLKTPASRTNTLYSLSPSHPQRLCALLSISIFLPVAHFATLSPATCTYKSQITTYSQLFVDSSSSHGCPQVLSMDVRKVSRYFATHCRKPHS
jgi:hypothetical protein